jgi:hypothetical protein
MPAITWKEFRDFVNSKVKEDAVIDYIDISYITDVNDLIIDNTEGEGIKIT